MAAMIARLQLVRMIFSFGRGGEFWSTILRHVPWGKRPLQSRSPTRKRGRGVPLARASGSRIASNTRQSRRRHGQQLLVFGSVFVLARARGNQNQIVIHFIPHEDLAELGDEQAALKVAGELLKLTDVLGRRFAHEIT